LQEIITKKVLFSPKNEYLRLDSNDFKTFFYGKRLEGMNSIDRNGSSLIFGLQLLAFDSS